MKLAHLDNKRLENSLARTEKYLEELSALEEWIDNTHKTHLAREYVVHTEQELADLRAQFKVGI